MAKHISPSSSSSSGGVSRSPRTPFKSTRILSPFSRFRARSMAEKDSNATITGIAVLVIIIVGTCYTFELCPLDASKLLRVPLGLRHVRSPKAAATSAPPTTRGSTTSPAAGDPQGAVAATAKQSVASFYAEAGNFRCPQPQRYTKAEVARHATEDDLWVVVDGNVLDVSAFVKQHPGGAVLLDGAGGHEMATVFARFHDPTSVSLFASFCIGQIQR